MSAMSRPALLSRPHLLSGLADQHQLSAPRPSGPPPTLTLVHGRLPQSRQSRQSIAPELLQPPGDSSSVPFADCSYGEVRIFQITLTRSSCACLAGQQDPESAP